jgi:hypothetical protein
MTYIRSWKCHRLTSHTWLGLNPQIGRPLSRIVGAIGLLSVEQTIHASRQKEKKRKILKNTYYVKSEKDFSG